MADILPSVRKRGVIQPVIVRPNCAPRRMAASRSSRARGASPPRGIVADERARRAAGPPEPTAVRDPRRGRRCRRGRGVADREYRAARCRRGDAMGDASPGWSRKAAASTRSPRRSGCPTSRSSASSRSAICCRASATMYAAEEIDRATVRHLTLASKRQQTGWLALADDPDKPCADRPPGQGMAARRAVRRRSRSRCSTSTASGLATVSDLFGEDALFRRRRARSGPRRTRRSRSAARPISRTAGRDVVIVPASEYFQSWEYEKTPKRKGGRVYIDVRSTGEVTFHEGYVSRQEAARARARRRARRIRRSRSVPRSRRRCRPMSICTATPPCARR